MVPVREDQRLLGSAGAELFDPLAPALDVGQVGFAPARSPKKSSMAGVSRKIWRSSFSENPRPRYRSVTAPRCSVTSVKSPATNPNV
jgi:hypothetical protein